MEESPEAHMETDVSSTTEDVPEAQEVTGSNGNVEMVVIVEKVTEEESNPAQSGGKQLSPSNSEAATSSNTPSPRPSPQKLTAESPRISPQKPATELPRPSTQKTTPQSPRPSPQKSLVEPKSVKTPTKVLDTPNTLHNVEHSYNKSPSQEEPCATLLSTSQSEETVDSSCKIEVQKSPLKIVSTPKKLSPIKVIDIQKSPRICPVDLKPSPGKEQKDTQGNSSPKIEIIPEKPSMNGTVANSNLDNNDNNKTTTVPIENVVGKDSCNDSHVEVNSDVSEKEHNKSISRELKSLIKSAKESKIISECTQLTTKTRKSRAPLDISNSSLNVSVEAEKIKDTRRGSDNSQKSNCSEKSEKVPVKRSMRSQNPEFVHKVKQFLNSVTSKVQKESDEGTDEEFYDTSKEAKVNKDNKNELTPLPKKKRVPECAGAPEGNSKLRSDSYCWRCHWEVEQAVNEKAHPPMACTVCPRTFHYKCLSGVERSKINTEKNWVCPECMGVLHAESSETRSPAMKKISLSMLCELLKHAIERLMDLNGVEPFVHPVDRNMFPDYEKYVVHPMDLTQMRDNITASLYGSTEAFLADAQWILHNSIIFNTLQSKLTAAARTLVRSCRAEMGEIEACPECYAAAHARKPTWFTDVCSTPHMLLWAKLKGFPYWPAKGMSVNNSGLVDVRFFGAHDRAWVPAKDCYLYSEKDPNNFRTKRQDILDSMQEAEEHIRNISRKYGKFVYPPFKTQFDPVKLNEQLKMMIPSYEGEVGAPVKEKQNISPSMVKEKSRSNSKSSKSSLHDGDMSEGEEPSQVASRKMADGAHIARLEDDEKDKSMEVDVCQVKEDEKSEKSSRKRRRSEMEEAAYFTIISSSTKEKKKKKEVESDENAQDMKAETESQTSTSSSKEDLNKSLKPAGPKDVENSTPKSKDNEPTSSTAEKEKDKDTPRLTPIKLVISTKANRMRGKSPICKSNTSTPKVLPIKIRQAKLDKTLTIVKIAKDKEQKETKSQKRRNSKSNKSLNNSITISTEKQDKASDKKVEKNAETAASKEKKDSKCKEDANKSTTDKPGTPKPNVESPKAAKDRIQFDDDDTSLAVIAREVKGNVTNTNMTGLPTISSVRSLSTAPNANSKGNAAKTIEVTIEPNAGLLIPTSMSNVRKEVAKGKDVEPSLVGRVGVRAFARMASPEPQRSKDVEVEIKAEPIDFDDQDRQLEKLDMMKAFKLRPVNPPPNSLREVRINKVVMTPLNARKTATKPAEVRPRARKTFPQPRKSDDGRSELNSKNSMVYIPIQPPATPGPLRPVRPAAPGAAPVPPGLGTRPQQPLINTSVSANSIVNTVAPPLVPSSAPQLAGVSSPGTSGALPLVPAIGQVPTTVHTVPLITSVNGQWTFSLQPIMSVGGLDDAPSPPLLNGLPERPNAPPGLLPLPSSAPAPISVPNNVVTSASLPAPAVTSAVMPSCAPAPAPAAAPLVMPAPASAPLVLPPPVPVSGAPAQTMSGLTAVPVVTPNRTTGDAPANPGEPPRLQQRPALMNPLDSHTPIGNVPTPSSAGPVTAKLNQNAVKLTDFFRSLLEDSLEKLDEPLCQVTALKLQLEQTNWRHKQEIEELKHIHDLVIAEMRSSFEKDKVRLTNELRRAAQTELEAAVKAAKSKQWCANCSQEAQFYCCWNTSYCDYPCQRAHWTSHFSVCTQQRAEPDAAGGLSAPPDALPKNSTAPSTTPTLTVGGKLAQARMASQDQAQKSQSIIMSMVEDPSGNQTLRCLGTYKPPSAPPTNQMPIIINKPVINNEDASGKKVVTSGGYLIVGANAGGSSVVTPPRRTHSIQYYT